MKAMSILNLTRHVFKKQAPLLCFVLSLSACSNYTMEPLCSEGNAVTPEGISGLYTVSTQDAETFEVTTSEMEIRAQGGKLLQLSKEGEEESSLCQVAGKIIVENYNKDVKGYEHQQLFVTGMGITQLPIMYGKSSLDAAGVPNSIFEIPTPGDEGLLAKVTAFVDRALVNYDAAQLGLMINNTGYAPKDIIAHAKTSPVGLTLLRK